jgi:hypothetical protein
MYFNIYIGILVCFDQQKYYKIKLFKEMATKMMSAGGKFYEKCRKIHPSTKAER